MAGKLDAFNEFRSRMNEKLLGSGNLQIKRFFALDTQAYTDGALSARVKELMGLVASAVLRCDDCIAYHLIRCAEEGVTDAEFLEAFNVILVVGGSITIHHLRRAMETLEEIRERGKRNSKGSKEPVRILSQKRLKNREKKGPHAVLG